MDDMGVVDEIQDLLQKPGLEVERRVQFDWLTNKAPLEEGFELPSRLKYRLLALHSHLGGDVNKLHEKPLRHLHIDFRVNETTLLEVDHAEHFSSDRLASLSFYEDMTHRLDLGLYRQLCKEHHAEADAYRRSWEAVDFSFEGGRRAQRAFLDTVQDLLTAAHGYRLIRLPAPENEMTDTIELMLRVLL